MSSVHRAHSDSTLHARESWYLERIQKELNEVPLTYDAIAKAEQIFARAVGKGVWKAANPFGGYGTSIDTYMNLTENSYKLIAQDLIRDAKRKITAESPKSATLKFSKEEVPAAR